MLEDSQNLEPRLRRFQAGFLKIGSELHGAVTQVGPSRCATRFPVKTGKKIALSMILILLESAGQ
jgi:hypothetical protein